MNTIWAFAPIIPIAATWLAVSIMIGDKSSYKSSQYNTYSQMGGYL